MIKITDISLSLSSTQDDIKKTVAKKLGIGENAIKSIRLLKKSVDARKKYDIRFVYNVCVQSFEDEQKIVQNCTCRSVSIFKEEEYTVPHLKKPDIRPIIVGFGPGGMFCALILAQAGLCPLVIERGDMIEKRKAAVDFFRAGGAFSELSNIQFGEGGAGTFSDGKLGTNITDTRIKKVFEEFVLAGAPEEILYESKPHIGTDLLPDIVKKIRETIISLGGEVRFCEKLTHIEEKDGKLSSIKITRSTGEEYKELCENLVLAIGHSARDTFRMLFEKGLKMEQKPFSVGARIEHPQELINKSQYGKFYQSEFLGAADYKLAEHLKNTRGVYTFCMCPGGEVVCASSESGELVTNGMSNNKRDGKNANSALLVGVSGKDFGSDHPLSGIDYQRKLEKTAFSVGGGGYTAPAQRVEDFMAGKASHSFKDVYPSIKPGAAPSNLDLCLPKEITDSMREGIELMDRKLSGFNYPDAVLTGVETRSSSPVRIVRNCDMQSVTLTGLYPCGEGAGYAGGITSSAVDGIKCAEKIIDKMK